MIAKAGVTFIGLGLACGLGMFTDERTADAASTSDAAGGGLRLAGDQSITLLAEPSAPGSYRIVATIRDHRSDPVVGAEVFFSSAAPSSFPLGVSTTDENGNAFLRYIESPFSDTETFRACVPTRTGIPRGDRQLSCAFIYTPPAECFLVIGAAPGAEAFPGSTHTWDTQLSGINNYFSVTQADLKTFVVSSPGSRRIHESAPTLVDDFCVQMLMWNPVHFSSNPERFSSGLHVQVFSNGDVTGSLYGTRDGMEVSFETFVDEGQVFLQFPFTIDGV